MSDNMSLWRRVSKTDPHHVKPITGKQYSGNSPKPYYIVERLTEEFGPCGIGWGFSILNERMERLSGTDVLHVAVVRFWYELNGKRGELEQIGQTKTTYVSSKDKLIVDEDAPKKSVTDALVKCASYLGFAGDIFSGRWDDSKYVAELQREFDDKHADESRKKWLANWLTAIEGVHSSGELKRVMHESIADARKYKDADAEAQFISAGNAKAAKAKASITKTKEES